MTGGIGFSRDAESRAAQNRSLLGDKEPFNGAGDHYHYDNKKTKHKLTRKMVVQLRKIKSNKRKEGILARQILKFAIAGIILVFMYSIIFGL